MWYLFFFALLGVMNLIVSPQNSRKVLTSKVTIFDNRAFEEVTKIKLGNKSGDLIQWD